jgi:hypothetical protein
MPASSNKRTYYAIKQAQIAGDGYAYKTVYGLQEAGSRTAFNLSQVFELGQAEVYEHVEDIPDVEITLSKLLDGRELIWHKCTGESSVNPTLKARGNEACAFKLGLWEDTNESATGAATMVVESSGMYPSAISYTFPIGGEFSEAVTLVGNDRVWSNDSRIVEPTAAARSSGINMTGSFSSIDSPTGSGGVNRREDLLFDAVPDDTGALLDINGAVADSDATILPPIIFGISDSGTNEQSNGEDYDCHVQNITVSTDLGREPLFELGRKGPYFRLPSANIQVTCDIEIISTSGDQISATEEGILSTSSYCGSADNTEDSTIRIATCEGARIYLGPKNRLTNVDFGGGDTGGGNDSVTYSFVGFNTMTVLHPAEAGTAAVSGSWWDNRGTYLLDT